MIGIILGKKAEITITKPLEYLEFLQLEGNAKLILTYLDSLQEVACILGAPLRYSHGQYQKRPKTVDVGANPLVGTDPDRIISASQKMWSKNLKWKNPLGR